MVRCPSVRLSVLSSDSSSSFVAARAPPAYISRHSAARRQSAAASGQRRCCEPRTRRIERADLLIFVLIFLINTELYCSSINTALIVDLYCVHIFSVYSRHLLWGEESPSSKKLTIPRPKRLLNYVL